MKRLKKLTKLKELLFQELKLITVDRLNAQKIIIFVGNEIRGFKICSSRYGTSKRGN
jgi:hypothetical protein